MNRFPLVTWLVSFTEDGMHILQTEEVPAEDQRDAEKQFEVRHRNSRGYTIMDVKRLPGGSHDLDTGIGLDAPESDIPY